MFSNDKEYFADTEFVSNSQLKDFDHCKYLYEGKHITKIFKDEEEHDYFTYGSAVDCLLTEPDGTFAERFFAVERRIDTEGLDSLIEASKILEAEIKEKTEAGKPVKMLTDRLDKMKEKIETIKMVEGKQQLTMTMYENVKDSAAELSRQPLYKLFGVNEGNGSQTILTAEVMGLKIKGKLDYLNVGKIVIADVKTVSTMERFNPLVYARQLAFYRMLAHLNYDIPLEHWDCYLLVVDKGSSVKRSEIFYISKRAINEATEELMKSLEKFQATKEMGFYTPAPEDQEIVNARRDRCFSCPFYNQCAFSVQREITIID